LSRGTKHKDPKRGPFEMSAEDDSSDSESTLFVPEKASLYRELVESGAPVTYGLDDPNGGVGTDTTGSDISKSTSSTEHRPNRLCNRNLSDQAFFQDIQNIMKDSFAIFEETMKRMKPASGGTGSRVASHLDG
jgi:hypothetical protein